MAARKVSPLRHRVQSWVLLSGFCLLIFVQSSLPSPDMGPDLPGQDKLLHLAAYAVLGFLAGRAFATLRGLRSGLAVCLAAFLFAFLFGLSDEWHQSFVPGRMADGWDLLADGMGALIGAVAHGWRNRRKAAVNSVLPR